MVTSLLSWLRDRSLDTTKPKDAPRRARCDQARRPEQWRVERAALEDYLDQARADQPRGLPLTSLLG